MCWVGVLAASQASALVEGAAGRCGARVVACVLGVCWQAVCLARTVHDVRGGGPQGGCCPAALLSTSAAQLRLCYCCEAAAARVHMCPAPPCPLPLPSPVGVPNLRL